MNTDRFFGGPTNLTQDAPLITSHSPHLSASKAIQLYNIGIKLRQQLLNPTFRLPKPAPNKPFGSLPPREQGLITFLLLSANKELLESLKATHPTIAQLITESQILVPLAHPSKIQLLITTPDAKIKALKQAYALFEKGKCSNEQLVNAAKQITGLELSALGIQRHIQIQHNTPTAPQWVFYGAGSESKAYQDGFGIVYKVAPVNEAMLDIPPIKDGGPLYPRIGEHLFSNALNQIPIFERSLAAATLPGLAPTEIVAFTESGDVVFKQVDFGNEEPTAHELHNWAIRHGHMPLPAQGEDPEKQFDNDTSVLPVIVRNGGQFHLILDLNPRNCRRVKDSVGTTIVPFDIISRPLLDAEIKAHPQIKIAVHHLLEQPTQNNPRGLLDAAHTEIERLNPTKPQGQSRNKPTT